VLGGHDCGACNTVGLTTWLAPFAHGRHSCDMYNIVVLITWLAPLARERHSCDMYNIVVLHARACTGMARDCHP